MKKRQSKAIQQSIKHFHIRLRMLGYSSYSEYLRSEHWAEVRRCYQQTRHWECGAWNCNEIQGLNLHHRTYENLGAEQAFLWQLIPLCRKHHQAVHRYSERRQATIAKATRITLTRSKQLRRERRKARRFQPHETELWKAVERRLNETDPRTDATDVDRRGVDIGQRGKNARERVR